MAEALMQQRGSRKERTGVVASRSGQKTVVVQVETRRRHPVYGKEVREFRKFHCHDEGDAAKVGDKVRIVESRPLSRLKRWRVAEILPAAGR